MISSLHGELALHVVPAFAMTVVGLKEIFCSVLACWDVTVALIVNGPYVNVAIGTTVVQAPLESCVVWPGCEATMNCWSDEILQSGVQNWIYRACAESGTIRTALSSSKAIFGLRIFMLPCLVLNGGRSRTKYSPYSTVRLACRRCRASCHPPLWRSESSNAQRLIRAHPVSRRS